MNPFSLLSSILRGISICTEIALHSPPHFKKKFLNYPPLFSPHLPLPSPPLFGCIPVSSTPVRCLPHLLPPSDAAPSNAPPGSVFSPSPLRHHSLPPSRHRPPPSHLLFLPFFPSTLPSLPGKCSSGTIGSPAPALSRCPSDFLVPALSNPQRPLSFGTIRPNKTECRASVSVLSGSQCPLPSGIIRPNRIEQRASVRPIWSNGGPFRTKALCSIIFGRTEALGSAKQDQTETLRSILFDRMVLKEREVLWVEAEKLGRGAEREHVPKSGRRVMKKWEKMEGRGAMSGRGEEMRAASEGGRRWEQGCGEKKGG